MESINKKNKTAKVKDFMVRNHMWVFVNCQIENPAFDSQVQPPPPPLKPASATAPKATEARALQLTSSSYVVGCPLMHALNEPHACARVSVSVVGAGCIDDRCVGARRPKRR